MDQPNDTPDKRIIADDSVSYGVVQGEEALMQHLSELMTQGMRDYAVEHGARRNWADEVMSISVGFAASKYYLIASVNGGLGAPIRGFEQAEEEIKYHGALHGLSVQRIDRQYVNIRGVNLREVVACYNDTFLANHDKEHWIDFDALARLHGVDPSNVIAPR